MGHDSFYDRVFRYFYDGSAHNLSERAYTAAVMYHSFGGEKYRTAAKDALERLLCLKVTDKDGAHLYFKNSGDDSSVAEAMEYFTDVIPLAFAEALSLWRDDQDAGRWLEAAESFIRMYEKTAGENYYGKTSNMGVIDENGGVVRSLCSSSDNYDMGTTAVILVRLSEFFGRERCLGIAGRLLDWVLGCNPRDASSVEGVGHNQPQHAYTTEFFPPTPQIPGAVVTEISAYHLDPASLSAEYDLPVAGRLLYALALYFSAMCDE